MKWPLTDPRVAISIMGIVTFVFGSATGLFLLLR